MPSSGSRVTKRATLNVTQYRDQFVCSVSVAVQFPIDCMCEAAIRGSNKVRGLPQKMKIKYKTTWEFKQDFAKTAILGYKD